MKNIKIALMVVFCFGWLFLSSISSADPQKIENQGKVYGWELMTPKERAEHQEKIRSMKTKEERERYRIEHHKKMQERMKGSGMTLPEKPRSRNNWNSGDSRGGGGRRR